MLQFLRVNVTLVARLLLALFLGFALLGTLAFAQADPLLDMPVAAPDAPLIVAPQKPATTGVPWVDDLMHQLVAVLSVIAMLSTVFAPVLKMVWPLFAGWVKTVQLRQAIQAVDLALKPAASAAYAEEERLLKAAAAKDSDGGEVVTEAEQKQAAERGFEVGTSVLKRSGMYDRVRAVFSEQDLRESFHAGTTAKISQMRSSENG